MDSCRSNLKELLARNPRNHEEILLSDCFLEELKRDNCFLVE